ncbi:MAG: CheR family methyltransferase [Caldimonas sp.]
MSARGALASAEFPFGAADFERVRSLIHRKAGISLHSGKHAMVYSRLTRRLREIGHRSVREYLDGLEAMHGAAAEAEWQEFVNCLTTNLTAFFREEHHFPILGAELAARGREPLRVWCNAASTGEEPYSIAMTVIEALGPAADVAVVCSDIDTHVLAIAERGIYEAGAKGLDPNRLKRHFLRGSGANAGSIMVKPELRRLVEFRACNLMDPSLSLGAPFDFVFCRNVMIYFDAATQRAVLERMHRATRPGALLFAGHSENFNDARDLFQLRAKTVYGRA